MPYAATETKRTLKTPKLISKDDKLKRVCEAKV